MNTAIATATNLAGRYLTIILQDEIYGIAVLKVREIIRYQKVTPVPHLPAYVKGVIDLRGRVIPIIDLRLKFGLQDKLSERTCIVVVQVSLESDGVVPMGLVVDGVEEVAHLVATDIEMAPEFGVSVDSAFLLGMAKVKGQVQMLLDIDRVVSSEVTRAIVGRGEHG